MEGRVAVVDTNVVVSALIGRSSDAPPARILDAMLGGRMPFVLSLDLLAEYRDVLCRPLAVARHGLSEAEVDEILQALALSAIESPSDVSPHETAEGIRTGMEGIPTGMEGIRTSVESVPTGVEEQDAHVAGLVLTMPGAVLVSGEPGSPEGFGGLLRPGDTGRVCRGLGLVAGRGVVGRGVVPRDLRRLWNY